MIKELLLAVKEFCRTEGLNKRTIATFISLILKMQSENGVSS